MNKIEDTMDNTEICFSINKNVSFRPKNTFLRNYIFFL